MPRLSNRNKNKKRVSERKRLQRDWTPENSDNHNKKQRMEVDSPTDLVKEEKQIKINELNEWSIQTKIILARIINIGTSITNATGILVNVIIGDDHGDQRIIRLTLRDKVASDFIAKFKNDQILKIYNWRCVQNLSKFNNTSHHFELHSNFNTVIEKVKTEVDDIPKIIFPNLATSLKIIKNVENRKKINCVGVIISISEIQTTQKKKTGETLQYVDVCLADQTTTITVRFWKDILNVNDNMIGKIIICYSAVVNQWNNATSLNHWNHFKLIDGYTGNNVQVKRISKWIKQKDATDLTEITQKLGSISRQTVDWSKVEKQEMIAVFYKLKDLKQVHAINKEKIYFKFDAVFKFIHGLSRTSEEWYVSAKVKNKKLDFDGEKWFDKRNPNGKRYSSGEVHRLFAFKGVIEDMEEDISLNVQFFNDAGEQLLEIRADDAYKMKSTEATIDNYKAIIDAVKEKNMNFVVLLHKACDRNMINKFFIGISMLIK